MDSQSLRDLRTQEKNLFMDVVLAAKNKQLDPRKVMFRYPDGLVNSSEDEQKKHYTHLINEWRRILAKTV